MPRQVRVVIDTAVDVDLSPVLESLARIERALAIEGDTMSEIDDRITEVEQAEEALDVDLHRELADLLAAVAPKLSDEENARFAALVSKLTAAKADIDTADP